jgi:hypothetical protein
MSGFVSGGRGEFTVATESGRRSAADRYIRSMESVPGWFTRVDARLLLGIDRCQAAEGIRGDLLEIGVYLGKSAILLGYLPTDGEALHVCDLFEPPGHHPGADRTHAGLYVRGDQAAFEANYRRFHPSLPAVHVGESSGLEPVLEPGSFRLVHIDGSHAYETVRADLALAHALLVPGAGVVVCDDHGNHRTPGVTAAVWNAIDQGGWEPLAVSPKKLYAVRRDPAAPPRVTIEAVLAACAGVTATGNDVGAWHITSVEQAIEAPSRTRYLVNQWVPVAARRLAVRARSRVREQRERVRSI